MKSRAAQRRRMRRGIKEISLKIQGYDETGNGPEKMPEKRVKETEDVHDDRTSARNIDFARAFRTLAPPFNL